jgi:O-antigen/teichoic acid export membrane protein
MFDRGGGDKNHRRAVQTRSLADGLAWNALSLGFLAIAGVALNLAIGRLYGAAALGTFNIAFALFIFLSQIATFGLQYSALRYVPRAAADLPQLRKIVYGGLAACAAVATLVTLIALLATPLIARLFPRVPDLSLAWMLAAPGLLPFAINKYLLGVLNGMQSMRAFAVFQSLRFVFILLGLTIFVLAKLPAAMLAGILSAAEFVLSIALTGHIVRCVAPLPPSTAIEEGKEHLRFGAKVFPAGMVGELNTRVDVLMVGALMSDQAAGIYPIAALIFEAALQGVVVVRNNINPRLAWSIAQGERGAILKFSRRVGYRFTPLLAAGAVIAYVVFPMVAPLIFSISDFEQAHEPLLWLMIALPLAGAPLCYGLVLAVAGYPLWQSAQMTIVLTTGVVLNLVLIPWLGMVGAAIAMGVSTIVAGWLSVLLARTVAGLRLFI